MTVGGGAVPRRIRGWFDVLVGAFIGRMAFALIATLVVSTVTAWAGSGEGGATFSLGDTTSGIVGGLIAGAIQWGVTREAVRKLQEDHRSLSSTVTEHLRDHATGTWRGPDE